MNITFLIGNGFDLNLGLNTLYSDFVKDYKGISTDDEQLMHFRDYIKDNEELWANAEIALGQYTGELGQGQGAVFSKCHKDFCVHLSEYLKQEEWRVDYEKEADKIATAFLNLNAITKGFPVQEKRILSGLYKKREAEDIQFSFVCYNYTYTLKQCLEVLKQKPNALGSHRHNGNSRKHMMGQFCQVHGTVDSEMVFGVHDESQIADPTVFECDYGEIYKNLLIKQQANNLYLEDTDNVAAKIINSSSLIYIYGMSIGKTDKLWWDRICTWLRHNSERHLIIQKYEMSPKEVFPVDYKINEQKQKRNILQYGKPNPQNDVEVEKRIHITGENIFKEIKGIAGERIK
ncbi:MAG: bacteriophage abortive infection AbiH family protein [Lachnospiraceae bacterium]|nr:bacteriophage abortive infection AbiH family protein [Lachnospiraceae bacterium]